MKRSIFLATCCTLALIAIADHKSSAQEKARVIGPAPAASAEMIARLVESGAYQYGVSIRSTTGDEEISLGGLHSEEPHYSGVAAKGIESFAGIPMKTNGEIDTELPCSLYYKIKVVSLKDETARVKLTVVYASDAKKDGAVATWNEQIWTANRDVRLNETDSVEFTSPAGKDVPSFQVRYRVRKFEGKIQ